MTNLVDWFLEFNVTSPPAKEIVHWLRKRKGPGADCPDNDRGDRYISRNTAGSDDRNDGKQKSQQRESKSVKPPHPEAAVPQTKHGTDVASKFQHLPENLIVPIHHNCQNNHADSHRAVQDDCGSDPGFATPD